MKLSFSTNGWEAYSWDEWLDAAEDMKLHGVEVYAPQDSETLLGRGGPFHTYARAATVRALHDRRLSVPNLDSGVDLSDSACVEALRGLIALAADLRVPCVSACAVHDDEEAVRAHIAALLPEASEKGVTLLIKTKNTYASTERLRDLMNHFACDELAVLWDMHETCRRGHETAAETIRNLGAYVRHVHLHDSDDDGAPALIGEGTLPVRALMEALSSINYDGFISLE